MTGHVRVSRVGLGLVRLCGNCREWLPDDSEFWIRHEGLTRCRVCWTEYRQARRQRARKVFNHGQMVLAERQRELHRRYLAMIGPLVAAGWTNAAIRRHLRVAESTVTQLAAEIRGRRLTAAEASARRQTVKASYRWTWHRRRSAA